MPERHRSAFGLMSVHLSAGSEYPKMIMWKGCRTQHNSIARTKFSRLHNFHLSKFRNKNHHYCRPFQFFLLNHLACCCATDAYHWALSAHNHRNKTFTYWNRKPKVIKGSRNAFQNTECLDMDIGQQWTIFESTISRSVTVYEHWTWTLSEDCNFDAVEEQQKRKITIKASECVDGSARGNGMTCSFGSRPMETAYISKCEKW